MGKVAPFALIKFCVTSYLFLYSLFSMYWRLAAYTSEMREEKQTKCFYQIQTQKRIHAFRENFALPFSPLLSSGCVSQLSDNEPERRRSSSFLLSHRSDAAVS